MRFCSCWTVSTTLKCWYLISMIFFIFIVDFKTENNSFECYPTTNSFQVKCRRFWCVYELINVSALLDAKFGSLHCWPCIVLYRRISARNLKSMSMKLDDDI
jgi:hypothetical protein